MDDAYNHNEHNNIHDKHTNVPQAILDYINHGL